MSDSMNTLPHQVTQMQVNRKVETVNERIQEVNEDEQCSVYLLSSTPSFDQIRAIDSDLKELYDTISEHREEDKEVRKKLLNARQAVRELIEMYSVYDSITRPTESNTEDNEDEGKGGVSNAV